MACTPPCTACSSVTRRARFEAWLNRRWYDGTRPVPWLLPLSWLFAVLAATRRLAYRLHLLPSHQVGVPVVVVGNLNAGGSGKTPVVIALVAALREAGHRPGVVSRGYGARVQGVRVLRDGDSADAVGDEPALICGKGIPVAIGKDRVTAARALQASAKVSVIVADDGLQHYRMARDCEVVVIDGRRRLGNGALLPAGPLREPQSRLASVDLVLTSGPPVVGESVFRLVAGECYRLGGAERRPLSAFRGKRVHAVAGTGDPRRFFDMLARSGVYVTPHPFPDHHAFVPEDIAFDDDKPVLMTEKDAVKCTADADDDIWVVPVTAELEPAAVSKVLECVDAAEGK